ncbi:MAG: ABC transporter substrate-binding protein [Actinobacteria bacterium]|nr:ABC transporter substrate-binding protein [Actinomycetota bacterium]
MKIRSTALLCALALVVAACGSRLSEDDLASGAGTGGGAVVTTPAGSGTSGAGITEGEGDTGPKVGTLPVPCGEAEGGGAPAKPNSTDPGVSADTIKIAVISDRAAVVKVPTASIEESMQAFVDFCNGFGGINGRKLELTKIDSKLFSHLEATKEACDAGVFAIVGSGSVTDNQGAQQMVDCGLIEVPAYTVTAAKGMSERLVAPLPNPSDAYNVGPARFMAEEHPDAIKKAAIIHGKIDAVDVQARRVKEAYEAEGFTFIYDKQTEVVQENYVAEAKAMKDAGVEYFTMVSSTQETVKMLHDMKVQGVDPEVIDLGQQFYDPEMLAEPGAEGAFVLLNTTPFEEVSSSKALQAYLAAYDAVNSKGKPEPTSLGVQAFSAGLLWATATKAVGDDLTRANVLAELKKVKEWDGGGLHFRSDPGDNHVATCFMYSQIVDGKWVRYTPKKAGTWTCDEAFALPLTGDYGSGAKAGS